MNSTGKLESRSVDAHEGEIKSFSFAKDFSLVATAGFGGVRLLDPETLESIRFIKKELPMVIR